MTSPLTIGWEEWVAFPDLGLPAIRAKVDTGARTSALHASVIEPFGPIDKPQVRFLIQPNPDDLSLEFTCSAPVVDRRQVTSSNGEAELRYVIQTTLKLGDRTWPIEVTLTNRENMAYRMLFGRTSMPDDIVVDPNASFCQPELTFDLYKTIPRKRPVKRPLRIALLTKEPGNYSNKRLIEAGEARGHVVEPIDTSRCYMKIGARSSEVHYDGVALPRFDAVIPRIGPSITSYGLAVLRQFQNAGSYSLNEPNAIAASRDKLLAHQLLARERIGMPTTAFANSPKDTKDLISLVGGAPVILKLLQSSQGKGVVLADSRKAAESLVDAFRGLDAHFLLQEFVAEAAGRDTRCFVIGNKVVAAIQRQAAEGEFRSNLHRGGTAEAVRLTREEREIARRAAQTIGLNVAGVDILRTSEGPKVLEVNSSPGLEGIENATGKNVAELIIQQLEGKVRPLSREFDNRAR